ncbi:MAG: dTDP-4-dehydrorhamnose 3,5-epimerase [Lachnospiraceae bacterium]|nr:dTDP-4-dehydrorhamnose 3,5-epimerase [Lachnospiraceae bacterium]
MSQIRIRETSIKGLLVVEPTVHRDERGFFVECYNERDFREAGIGTHFVQDNISRSVRGVLRGLHFQKQYPQAKLVRASRGEVFDVAVDLRKDSPTFGQWHGEILSETNFRQMYVPEGFAHGYFVLSPEAEFCYKVNDFYHPGDEGGLAFNDPDIGIEWPLLQGEYPGAPLASAYRMEDGTPLILSPKDEKHPNLMDSRL